MGKGIRRGVSVAVVIMASFAPAFAHADDAACKDGHDRGRTSRDGGKLLEARKLLQQCSSASCASSPVHAECVDWLADVEARLPSVILSAEDGSGVDLVDVAVSIDGKEGPRKLDGRAVELDPGEHTFVFQTTGGQNAERKVVFHEHEKHKSVAVTIGAAGTPAAVAPVTPPVAEPAGGQSNAASPTDYGPPSGGSGGGVGTVRLVGFIAGGVGIASAVVGTIFGLSASSKLSEPRCDTSAKVCDPGVIDDAKSAATASTVAFVASGVLLVGGLALVFLGPKPDGSARLRVTPSVAQRGGGLTLGGAW